MNWPTKDWQASLAPGGRIPEHVGGSPRPALGRQNALATASLVLDSVPVSVFQGSTVISAHGLLEANSQRYPFPWPQPPQSTESF